LAGLEFAGRGRATPADAPRPRSLAETAYDAIEQMIISRRLAPGAMVSEGELGAELGLGRTPVREALARLKTIGFVEVHPRRGVLVTQVDIIKHLELLEVRRPPRRDRGPLRHRARHRGRRGAAAGLRRRAAQHRRGP
jgi:DNA-binding GntR family transcriptional regulator